MFEFMRMLKERQMTREEAAELLKTDPSLIDSFEKAYQKAQLTGKPSDNIFDINAKQASKLKKGLSEEELDKLVERIVDELLMLDRFYLPDHIDRVTNKDLSAIDESKRPQLTGTLMKVDVSVPSYDMLLYEYSRFLSEQDPTARTHWYNLFRQGLDILDLDQITYQIIGMNRNSIGYWFPALKKAVQRQDFFKVPVTKIIKVPMPVLQLTRLDYFSLTPATIKIVNRFCQEAFRLDPQKTYFIKTGTYSSKFDFRNAKVSGEKEVMEIGEYLLYIHWQAIQMAQPMSVPVIYGVSTTNEWAVREFIEDKEGNPCIYHGLPLHTEYRVFVDFDTDEILGIAPYWKPDVMKKRFGNMSDKDKPDMVHDYVIYLAHEDVLMKRYEDNKEKVVNALRDMICDVDLPGQWSVDIMQNGDDFWIIDMALAEMSALKECVPPGKLKKSKECWIPQRLCLQD